MIRLLSELAKENYHRHPFLASEFAFEIYAVLFLALLIGQYWVFHGITLVILAHIVEILLAWFAHVKEAREIRLFKGWLVWWMEIGLDFATSTLEGEVLHRVLVANSLNFWNMVGKKYTFKIFNYIIDDGRAKLLSRAKENIEQMDMHHSNFDHSTRESYFMQSSNTR